MDNEQNNSKKLGCLSYLIIISLFFFAISFLDVIIKVLTNIDSLSKGNTFVFGMKLFGVILIALFIIFRNLGGKIHKIILGGYAEENDDK